MILSVKPNRSFLAENKITDGIMRKDGTLLKSSPKWYWSISSPLATPIIIETWYMLAFAGQPRLIYPVEYVRRTSASQFDRASGIRNWTQQENVYPVKSVLFLFNWGPRFDTSPRRGQSFFSFVCVRLCGSVANIFGSGCFYPFQVFNIKGLFCFP